MKKIIIIVLLAIIAAPSFADDAKPELRAEIERMFELTDMTSMIDQMYSQMGSMFQQMVQQENIPAEQMAESQKYFTKLEALLKEELSWGKMKEPLIDVYVRVFTLEEIKAMNEFYETPVGKKMLAKMPQVMEESIQVSQDMARNLMPKIQAIVADMAQEKTQVQESK